MIYAYYPGCSLKGSAKRLDDGVRRVFNLLGITLNEIPDWNCCGLVEYGDAYRVRLLSKKNLEKALPVSTEVIAPCPLCAKNLKESNEDSRFSIFHPLDLLTPQDILSIPAKRDLKGHVFFPYYGCLLVRPKETAIKDREIMEKVILYYGGEVTGTEVKDRCCGGNRFFVDRELPEKLSRIILERSCGTIVVFCPLCHMVLKSFSGERKVVYFTDVIPYVLGEKKKL